MLCGVTGWMAREPIRDTGSDGQGLSQTRPPTSAAQNSATLSTAGSEPRALVRVNEKTENVLTEVLTSQYLSGTGQC